MSFMNIKPLLRESNLIFKQFNFPFCIMFKRMISPEIVFKN